MAEETPKCNCELKPLEEWVQIEDPEQCHSCLLPTLAGMYLGTLQDAGLQQEAERLKQVYESADGDVLTVARTMDSIRNGVGSETKLALEGLDCIAQTFKDTQDAGT